MIGKRYRVTRYLEDDPKAYYGAETGDVITVCQTPEGFDDSAIWVEQCDVFKDPNWKWCSFLCVANSIDDFNGYFEEVIE